MSAPRGPGELLRRLSRVAPVVRGATAGAVLSRGLATLALLAQAIFIARALGGAFTRAGLSIGADLAGLLIATLVRSLAVSGGDVFVATLARPLRRQLRRALLARRLAGSSADGVERYSLLATDGVAAIENYVATIVPSLATAVIAPILVVASLVLEDPWSALIVVVSVIVLPLFMILLGLAARDSMNERLDSQTRLAGYFGDVARGLASLRALGRSHAALDTLAEAELFYRTATLETLRVAFLSGFALELLASLATALVALVLGLRLVGGHVSLTNAFFALIVTPEVFSPLRQASAQFHASSLGVAAAGEVLEILERVEEPTGDAVLPEGGFDVDLADVVVGVTSRPGTWSEPLRGHLTPGAMLVVTGPSGVGKSTLLRALAGVSDPLRGEIRLAGRPLREYSTRDLRQRVVLLTQDPVLPGRRVGEIVDLGRGLSREVLEDALRASELELPLDLEVGEGASALSAGQRRRLGVARALAGSPDLLLLDEPLAHLDEVNARRLAETLGALRVTRVIATHRDLFDAPHLAIHRASVS